MSFGAAVKYCLSHPFTFAGRARRSEFWWFFLFLQIVSIVLAFVFTAVWFALAWPALSNADPYTGEIADDDVTGFVVASVVVWGIYFLVALFLVFPMLAANARRLHDIDQSAHWLWFYLAGLSIVPILMGISDGTIGPNRFGADPKAGERAAWPPSVPLAAPPAVSPGAPLAVPPPLAQPLAPPPYAPNPGTASDPAADPFAAPPNH